MTTTLQYASTMSTHTNLWPTMPFQELLAEPVRNGIYKSKEYHGRGQKIINMGELFGYDFISNQDMRRIELNAKELEKSLVRDGDLLFARRSLVLEGSGKCSLVVHPSEDTTFESSIIRARLNHKEAAPQFYYYFFRSPTGRALMASIASQTAVSGITGSNLIQLKVPHPPLPVQHRIAAILSAYDDLIANNARRIAILEEVTRALYREWFVEFRFPGHEGGQMVESAMGLVPHGWQVRAFSNAVYINPTTRVPKEGEKPFVPMRSLSETSMLINNIESRVGNSGSKFRNGDTVFARITPCLENGKTGFVQFLPSDEAVAFGSTEFIVMRPNTVCAEFVYLTARSDKFRDNAIKSMTGATGRQRVQDSCFDNYLIAQPDSSTLDAFVEHVAPIFRAIQIRAIGNSKLKAMRDLLLPRLVSGKLDVYHFLAQKEVNR